jgi:hypothetical protein
MNPNIDTPRVPPATPATGPEVTVTETKTVHDGTGTAMTATLARHLSDLSQEALTLVRGEIALAKVEVDEKIKQAQRAIVETLAGGAVVFAGFLVLLAAAVFGLANVVPLWLAALIVGLGTAIIGALAIGKGKHDLSAKGLKPDRLIEEGRRTKHFAQEQLP